MNSLVKKKLKIHLQYKNQTVIIDIEPYKTFKYLKERASKLFFPISNGIKILMNNKDQSQFEEFQIGDVYKNKPTFNFRIVDFEEFKQLKPEESFRLLEFVASENERIDKINHEIKKPETQDEKALLDKLARKTNVFHENRIDIKSEPQEDHEFLCPCKSNLYVSYFCRKCKDFICKACRINVILLYK